MPTTEASFIHTDLTGLNPVQMQDAPVVGEVSDAIACLSENHAPLSIAGMRHSQGGHTAVENGRMLITETLNTVHLPRTAGSPRPSDVTVDAGATWSDIHRQVCGHARAPKVQQSSAHFSIGGSLSVNCHGRDVRWGPVSDTVEEITVLLADGSPVQARHDHNSELFRAVLGGYGACGLLVQAQLGLTENFMLYRNWNKLNLAEYQGVLRSIHSQTDPLLHLHHGWVDVTADGYLRRLLSYTVHKLEPQTVGNENGSEWWSDRLRQEGWGTSEILRAGWAASRKDSGFQQLIWDRLSDRVASPQSLHGSRLDFLREDILFTSSKGDAAGVDLLQEYFVPIARLADFMDALKGIFPRNRARSDVQLLSCTTRYVRGEKRSAPYLSYTRGEARVSVAIDAHVQRGSDGMPTPKAASQFQAAIDAALAAQGSFYLPYHRFATSLQLQKGYPHLNEWLVVVNRFNPGRRFNNAFLQHYRL